MAEENTGGRDQTTREVGVARSPKRRSKVWEHFTPVTTADGEDKAKCNHCSAVLAADTQTHGTGTLWTHYRRHRTRGEIPREVAVARSRKDRPPARPPQPREAASESSNLKPGYKEACEDLARMIALRGYDSSVVEDDYFRSFVRRLNPDFQVPSRRTVEDICDGVSDEAKRDLCSKLEHTSGRVNLALGTAQTVEGTVFYIARHFIDDDWKLHKTIMYVYMVVPHTAFHGSLLGIREICFEDDDFPELCEFEYKQKVFSTAAEKDGDYLSLIEWMFVKPLQFYTTYMDEPEFYTIYMDDVLRSIAKRLMDHVEDTGTVYDFLQDPSLTRQKRQEILSNLRLDELWTYNEHWYSFYCSLEVAPSSTAEEDATRTRKKLFEETAFTELLRKLFGAIYRAIQKISAPSSPTSNVCLRELFKVREVLQSELEGASGDKADVYQESNGFDKGVADVLKEAKSILDKSIQESYLVWSVPLVLDPRYKLRYIESNFNNAFESGAATYVSEVETKIKEIFSYYNQDDKETSNEDSNCLTDMAVDSNVSLEHLFSDENESELQYDERDLQKRMEELGIELKPELDRYLLEVRDPETDDFDILKWWKDHSSTYPTVARMARDALAMPTCSKLSSELMSHIRSRVRGYSEEPFVE